MENVDEFDKSNYSGLKGKSFTSKLQKKVEGHQSSDCIESTFTPTNSGSGNKTKEELQRL